MNPLTNVKNIKKLSETELKYNISGKASWHHQYKDSAWVFIGGLPYDLSEGDVICIFSQYGEVVNINLVRDKATGKSKGFCFLCYEDQRSTILAVDNLNSIKVLGRTLRVDHVEQYKIPKDPDRLDEEALQILQEGCGPESSVVKHQQAPKPSLPLIPVKEERFHSPPQNQDRKENKQQLQSTSPKRRLDREADNRGQPAVDERSSKKHKERSEKRDRSRERDQFRSVKKERSKDREAAPRRERSRERERSDRRDRSKERERHSKRDRSRDRERSDKRERSGKERKHRRS